MGKIFVQKSFEIRIVLFKKKSLKLNFVALKCRRINNKSQNYFWYFLDEIVYNVDEIVNSAVNNNWLFLEKIKLNYIFSFKNC